MLDFTVVERDELVQLLDEIAKVIETKKMSMTYKIKCDLIEDLLMNNELWCSLSELKDEEEED